ncbi:MAG TPA: PKD domain-containing protein, partial [Patescibacteria group bacterium]|nr:PKD domain-containing protein [Patescibacteria group bacterium]
AENVFTRGIPTTVTILSVADASGTPIPTNTTAPGQPTNTPVPNGGGGSGGSGGNSGGSSGGSGSTDQPPVCSNIAANKVASDASGMTYQFSATGNDPDGTVSKVTFNFGDGTVQDVTNGTGTTSVNVAAQHTYGSSGTFTVSALLTDNSGAISTPSTCTQTLTVGSGGTSSNPTTAPLATATPTTGPLVSPTKIPATGPGSTILAIGMAGAALVVVGALFFVGL